MALFQSSDLAFVTGGGSGIGRATCQLLAEQGATVVAADINKKSADETILSLAGKNHRSVYLDVSKKDEVGAVIDEVLKLYSSPPNIAVNSAGLALSGSILDVSEEKYNRVFDVNVKGTVWVTQAVCRNLVSAKKSGSVVNICSITKDGMAIAPIYAATKGAVESFSLSAAKEFGPHGIRVNAVNPGFIDTPMLNPLPENIYEQFIKPNALRRIGKPNEVAEVVAFLASDKASYVNGTSMYVHGGHI